MPARNSKLPLPKVTCPNPLHADSVIVAAGIRERTNGTRQRYECRPAGYPRHRFSVILATSGAVATPQFSEPPRCPEHPDAKVYRNGTYGSGKAKRQRYRCFRTVDDKQTSHSFTPELPRKLVHVGTDHCDHCDELRGVHHGDKAAARHSTWTGEQVFDVLADVAKAVSYAKASRNARERAGRTTRREKKPADPAKRESHGAKEARRFWHTAADFTEIYAPTLWDYQEQKLRKRDKQLIENSHTPDLNQPNILILDDIPVFGKKTRLSTKREWNVLAAAQVIYSEDPEDKTWNKTTKLRLLRALPASDTIAWKVFLSELSPYAPDFVVSDGADAQIKAVQSLFPKAVIIPSLYHIRNNVETNLLRTPNCFTTPDRQAKRLVPTIRQHMKLMRAENFTQMTKQQWAQWWDDLIDLMEELEAPTDSVMGQRATYDALVPQMLKVFVKHPDITLSTGGLEVLLSQLVKPILKRRGHSFGNIERVNCLFDLVVCENNGLFNQKSTVLELLREDNEHNYGWSLTPRAVTDTYPVRNIETVVEDDGTVVEVKNRMPYSSLRDVTLLRQIARKQGLL